MGCSAERREREGMWPFADGHVLTTPLFGTAWVYLIQVEDGVSVPGLTIKQFASTADVEALMCSAAAQQHAASSHLVLSVYVACKDHITGELGNQAICRMPSLQAS